MPTQASSSSISADSPLWWQTGPQSSTNPPSKTWSKLSQPRRTKGIDMIEANSPMKSQRQNPQLFESHSVSKFDPVISVERTINSVPRKPTREDSLDSSRRTLPKARVEDPHSFNSRHADALSETRSAFFRTKGSMESYLEEAHKGRDLLVWQAAHPRGYTRGNNPSNFKVSLAIEHKGAK